MLQLGVLNLLLENNGSLLVQMTQKFEFTITTQVKSLRQLVMSIKISLDIWLSILNFHMCSVVVMMIKFSCLIGIKTGQESTHMMIMSIM